VYPDTISCTNMDNLKYPQRTPPPSSKKLTQKHQVDVIIARQETTRIEQHNDDSFVAISKPTDIDPYALEKGADPDHLTRKQLLKWATKHPEVNKRKNRTSTNDLRDIYRSIEAQQIEGVRLAAIEYDNRLLIAAAKQKRRNDEMTQVLLSNVPFLQDFGHLYKLGAAVDPKRERVVLTTTLDHEEALKPMRSHDVVVRAAKKKNSKKKYSKNNKKKIQRSTSSPARLDPLQARREALSLRSELRPLNSLFEKRQAERALQWRRLIAVAQNAFRICHSLARLLAHHRIVKWWRRCKSRMLWHRLTRPAVVLSLTLLRSIVRAHLLRKNGKIVARFIRAVGRCPRIRPLVTRVRYSALKIQRAWRTFVVVTKARLITLQLRWVHVEQMHSVELMDVVRRSMGMLNLVREQPRETHLYLASKKQREEQHLQQLQRKNRGQKKLKVNQQLACDTFDSCYQGVQETIQGKRKISPASFGKTDLSGAVVRLHRLMETASTRMSSSLLSQDNDGIGSLVERTERTSQRRKAKEERRREAVELEMKRARNENLRQMIALSLETMCEEPEELLVAYEVRRAWCVKMLAVVRKEWIRETPTRQRKSVRKAEGVYSIEKMRMFLLSRDGNNTQQNPSKCLNNFRQASDDHRMLFSKTLPASENSMLIAQRKFLRKNRNRIEGLGK